MARPRSLLNYTSDELHELWISTVNKEHELKRDLLKKAKATVKELEKWFKANKPLKIKRDKSAAPKGKKGKRAKRGELKKAIITYLKSGPQPIKSIVIATKGNYGSVFQSLNYLRKEKRVTKAKERGGLYTFVK